MLLMFDVCLALSKELNVNKKREHVTDFERKEDEKKIVYGALETI